jgi:surface polysaccharide O-acyltransferase-like enzyme
VKSVFPLELNNCAPLFIFNSGSIATPCLFESPNHFLKVQVTGQTLNECQAFSGSSLLEFYIY